MSEKHSGNEINNNNFFRMFSELTYGWESWRTLDGRYVYVTPSCHRITGYSPDEFYSDGHLMEKIIHPDWLEAWKSHSHAILKDGELEAIDFKIITKNDEEKWIRHICQAVRIGSPQISGIRASNIDITLLKRKEGALRETRDYLEKLFNYANAPIIVWNPETRITRFNYAFEYLTGYTTNEVIGQKLQMLFPEASRNESLNKTTNTLNGEYWESVEIPILHKDGSIRTALWNSANIYAEDGTTVIATIAQGQDITKRKHLEEELRLEAMYDALTGLMNRRSMMENLKHEVHRSLRSKNVLSIVMCDIDHFKSINDTYGHECGDKILKQVADVLKGNTRKQDLVSRWGGEEFLILLPDTLLKNAKYVAENLRHIVQSKTLLYDGQRVKISMSFGVSEYGFEATPDACIRKADSNLYEAKKKGRNMVV